MKNLKVGEKIEWISAAGVIQGNVKEIHLSLNAANTLTPWIIIENLYYVNNDFHANNTTKLCGTDSYLKKMKVSKI